MLKKMITDKWMSLSEISLGFGFDETMTGTWGDDPERYFQFTIRSVAPDGRDFMKTGRMKSSGRIHADGLTSAHVPCTGTLIMPVRQPLVQIELDFVGDDGKELRYVGSKRLSPLGFVQKITTFHGEIFDQDGNPLGDCKATFNLKKDLIHLLSSMRFKDLKSD